MTIEIRKVASTNDLYFVDFGTRVRFSADAESLRQLATAISYLAAGDDAWETITSQGLSPKDGLVKITYQSIEERKGALIHSGRSAHAISPFALLAALKERL